MLSTQNFKLLNQPSKKFRSRYIGPYIIIDKISSQAHKLDLPSSMQEYPVFYIWLSKEFNSSSSELEVPDDIPTYNDFIYDHNIFHVHYIIDKKSLHIHQLMQKTHPFPLKSSGKDMILPKTLGNL